MRPTLTQILARTRADLAARRVDRVALEARAQAAPPPRPFASALRRPTVALIGEVKRRSPSVGEIAPGLDPAAQARTYEAAGAAAVSVLTDGPHFGGSLADLEAVASAVAVPVLRKDFILDEVQLLEARAAGAAAVLLLVRALTGPELDRLLRVAGGLGLTALVEAHGERELELALATGAEVIGVNSRDLDTFEVASGPAWAWLGEVPADRVAVAESGIATVEDVEVAAAAGADAVLVGTALSASGDPGGLARGLASVPRRGR